MYFVSNNMISPHSAVLARRCYMPTCYTDYWISWTPGNSTMLYRLTTLHSLMSTELLRTFSNISICQAYIVILMNMFMLVESAYRQSHHGKQNQWLAMSHGGKQVQIFQVKGQDFLLISDPFFKIYLLNVNESLLFEDHHNQLNQIFTIEDMQKDALQTIDPIQWQYICCPCLSVVINMHTQPVLNCTLNQIGVSNSTCKLWRDVSTKWRQAKYQCRRLWCTCKLHTVDLTFQDPPKFYIVSRTACSIPWLINMKKVWETLVEWQMKQK